MKLSASDIANFYVQLSNEMPESDITNLKLNKLCYYAQGWSMVKLGEPLFDEQIQAWSYGPVIPQVYHTYKVCGRNPIAEASDYFNESRLSSEQLALLIDVYLTYGKYSSSELISMTHKPGSPWDRVYEEQRNNIIDRDSLARYFMENEVLSEFEPNATEDNTIDYCVIGV